MEKTAIEKRPITPTLRKMDVGDVQEFPKVQYSSLIAVKTRLRIELDIVFSHEITDSSIRVKRES